MVKIKIYGVFQMTNTFILCNLQRDVLEKNKIGK